MAHERPAIADEPDRPKPQGVPLADEGAGDELPAFMAVGLGVAFLVIAIVWPSMIAARDEQRAAAPVEVAEQAPVEDDEEEADEAPVEAGGPDLPAILAGLDGEEITGVELSAAGNVVTAAGEMPDQATVDAAVAYIGAQPNVDEVVNAMTLAEAGSDVAAATADVGIAAAQRSVVLTGTVPDQATRDALVTRAVEIYSEDKVDDQLEIDPATTPPARVTVTGSLTDPVLFERVLNGFGDIPGVEAFEPTITLEESSQLESSLNALEPIQFASGSAQVDAASTPILDQAAELLQADPDGAVEIGGHTDSIGSEESNLTLSQDRADQVKAELESRGVTNELVAEGFGERRLKNPDDENDTAAQQANRRIEFRLLG